MHGGGDYPGVAPQPGLDALGMELLERDEYPRVPRYFNLEALPFGTETPRRVEVSPPPSAS